MKRLVDGFAKEVNSLTNNAIGRELIKALLTWLTNFGISRFFSLVVAAGYLSIILFAPGAESIQSRLGLLLITAGYLVLPLVCIWFGEEIGNYMGTFPGPAINRRTPGCLVSGAGWVLLLFPVIVVLIMAIL